MISFGNTGNCLLMKKNNMIFGAIPIVLIIILVIAVLIHSPLMYYKKRKTQTYSRKGLKQKSDSILMFVDKRSTITGIMTITIKYRVPLKWLNLVVFTCQIHFNSQGTHS